MRRAFFGVVVNCWAASCCWVLTSHSRNSTRILPPSMKVWPVTSALAWICRQLAKLGICSKLEICSMKVAGSSGAK